MSLLMQAGNFYFLAIVPGWKRYKAEYNINITFFPGWKW